MKLLASRRKPIKYPLKMNFGCGYDKRLGFLNVDIEPQCDPDLLISPGDFSALPKSYFVELIANDVLEHVPRNDTLKTFFELVRTCEIGATVKIQTTSLEKLLIKLSSKEDFAEQYSWATCLFGNQAHNGDFHFTGFTDSILQTFCNAVGLEVVEKGFKDEWMFSWNCRKIQDWEYLLEIQDLAKFLSDCYQEAFGRQIDETGIINFTNAFKLVSKREEILVDIFSRPERLFYMSKPKMLSQENH
jgi:hypothetical protein